MRGRAGKWVNGFQGKAVGLRVAETAAQRRKGRAGGFVQRLADQSFGVLKVGKGLGV